MDLRQLFDAAQLVGARGIRIELQAGDDSFEAVRWLGDGLGVAPDIHRMVVDHGDFEPLVAEWAVLSVGEVEVVAHRARRPATPDESATLDRDGRLDQHACRSAML